MTSRGTSDQNQNDWRQHTDGSRALFVYFDTRSHHCGVSVQQNAGNLFGRTNLRPGVPTECLRLEDVSGRTGTPFDLVFALGMLPPEESAAARALHQLSGLARVGAIVIGFGAAAWGYAITRFWQKSAGRRGSPRLKTAE